MRKSECIPAQNNNAKESMMMSFEVVFGVDEELGRGNSKNTKSYSCSCCSYNCFDCCDCWWVAKVSCSAVTGIVGGIERVARRGFLWSNKMAFLVYFLPGLPRLFGALFNVLIPYCSSGSRWWWSCLWRVTLWQSEFNLNAGSPYEPK